jgi:hypothetical protein
MVEDEGSQAILILSPPTTVPERTFCYASKLERIARIQGERY